MKPALLLFLLAYFATARANANIGSTIAESQREYGSRGIYAAADNSAVTWQYRGWTVTEYYDPQGHCNSVVYRTQIGGFFNTSDISTILRANTPPGVAWNQPTAPSQVAFDAGVRDWTSTEYTVNGFVFSLAANLWPLDTADAVTDANGVTHGRQRLSIHV